MDTTLAEDGAVAESFGLALEPVMPALAWLVETVGETADLDPAGSSTTMSLAVPWVLGGGAASTSTAERPFCIRLAKILSSLPHSTEKQFSASVAVMFCVLLQSCYVDIRFT